jgi:hypothetical protein
MNANNEQQGAHNENRQSNSRSFGEVATWAQFLLALALAASGALWWSGGLGARVDSVEHRISEQARIQDAKHEALDREVTDLKLGYERVKAACPTRVDGLEARVGVLERIVGNLSDVGSLIRDSNELQRQRMHYEDSQK